MRACVRVYVCVTWAFMKIHFKLLNGCVSVTADHGICVGEVIDVSSRKHSMFVVPLQVETTALKALML